VAVIASAPPKISSQGGMAEVEIASLPGQTLAEVPPPPAPERAPTPAAKKPIPRIRVGGRVVPAVLVQQKAPEYPPMARQARIEGTVRLRLRVDERGNVGAVSYVSGPELLAPAARAAVRRWKYRPATLNGDPVAVDTEVEVNFTLR
jgi:protein TonB